MLNKINKAYGNCNHGIENYCRIQSLEAETKEDFKSDKELKWHQKVWNGIKKVCSAIWKAIVSFFKAFLNIVTFGWYKRHKEEQEDLVKLQKENDQLRKNIDEELKTGDFTKVNNKDDLFKVNEKNFGEYATSYFDSYKKCMKDIDNFTTTAANYCKKYNIDIESDDKMSQQINKLKDTHKKLSEKLKNKNTLNNDDLKIVHETENVASSFTNSVIDRHKEKENNPTLLNLKQCIEKASPKIKELDKLFKKFESTFYKESANKYVYQTENESEQFYGDRLMTSMVKLMNIINRGFGKSLQLIKKVYDEFNYNILNFKKYEVKSAKLQDWYYDVCYRIMDDCIKIKQSNTNLTQVTKEYLNTINNFFGDYLHESNYVSESDPNYIKKIVDMTDTINSKISFSITDYGSATKMINKYFEFKVNNDLEEYIDKKFSYDMKEESKFSNDLNLNNR